MTVDKQPQGKDGGFKGRVRKARVLGNPNVLWKTCLKKEAERIKEKVMLS